MSLLFIKTFKKGQANNEVREMGKNINDWLDKIYNRDLSVDIIDLVIDEKLTLDEAINKLSKNIDLDRRYIESVLPEVLFA